VLDTCQRTFSRLDCADQNERFTFCILTTIRNRAANHRWNLISVYEPAQHDSSEEFIQELNEICEKDSLPVVLGGDFNLIRNNQERSHGQGEAEINGHLQ
jgi:hypothetical protein